MRRQRNPKRTDRPDVQWSEERENGYKNYYRTEGYYRTTNYRGQGRIERANFKTSDPGEGNGNPLQYSCLENPMDEGAW